MTRRPVCSPRSITIDDSEWICLTGAANDALASKLPREALTLYRDAFGEAERLFGHAETVASPVPAATIYVISCQNLAAGGRGGWRP